LGRRAGGDLFVYLLEFTLTSALFFSLSADEDKKAEPFFQIRLVTGEDTPGTELFTEKHSGKARQPHLLCRSHLLQDLWEKGCQVPVLGADGLAVRILLEVPDQKGYGFGHVRINVPRHVEHFNDNAGVFERLLELLKCFTIRISLIPA
jgi:hypothetical protein